MRAFEVSFNEKKLCLAGVGEDGVLSAIVTWVAGGPRGRRADLFLEVGGLANEDHEVYEVQPGVQMAAKFASNGLVCEMRLEQAHFGKDQVYLVDGIDQERINGLIDELVPRSERGEEDKADPSNGMSIGLGQSGETVHSYSNVRVHVLSSLHNGTTIAYIIWRHRKCLP